MKVDRDDPKEYWFVESLLSMEEDLKDEQWFDKPMVFFVFGRGRALPPCVGKGINEDNLPTGVILTGGKVLREDELTGKGIRVAVIDSGVDQEHPGFQGRVKHQVWHRSGTPLEEDDHGTHVAGTIHLMAPEAEIYDYRVFGAEGELGVSGAIAKSIRQATDEPNNWNRSTRGKRKRKRVSSLQKSCRFNPN